MPHIEVNGARLYYELSGEGEGLALVHGSWADHHDWDLVAPSLAEWFRVLSYDRRGHSESEGGGALDDDVADLAALIEQLDLAPAHVVANSRGGAIALRLALARPELFRSVSVHEPPLLALLADDPESEAILDEANRRAAAVIETIEADEREAGARQFVEEVAVGEGAWDVLPSEVRATLIGNAGTFVEEERDPTVYALDLEALSDFRMPVLLTQGDQSPPFFARVLDRLERALPRVERRVFHGAGHVPELTHPQDYAAAMIEFAERS